MTSTTSSLDDFPGTAPAPAVRPDRRWAGVALAAAVLGFYGAATLVYERLQLFLDAGHRTSCDINSWLSCGTVMRTPQAEAFGFPNPFIGIVAYAVVAVIAAAVLAGARFAAWYWWCVQIGVTLGWAFVLWLWWQTTFEINALCLYCMLVWVVQTVLFAHTTARNLEAGVLPAPAALRRAGGAWAWFASAVLLVLVFGTVFVRFAGVILPA
ncbi:vitamin K epoxide reductase [Kocuria flava]|uniref:Membrane protein n=1 Tax=Kocuria flava TaxID=446860 RepID=A0A0U3G6A1_9MICC|nr:vitamin K epoxide reductase family protein [Kocuria flava]ALU40346.1 vitamin K epoxide reductase [Kocuria flava]GEO91002.1 membrane protein [Kocuria flava]